MRKVLLTRVVALAAAGLIVAGWPAGPAAALPAVGTWTGTTGLAGSATATTTEDVEVTVALSGDHLVIHENEGLNGVPFGAPSKNLFEPPLPVDGGWLGLSALDTDCEPHDVCHRGTLTISFSQPVVDPVIHVTGLGSHDGPAASLVPAGTVELALSASTPDGAELGEPAPGAANLTVTGDLIQATSPATALASCDDGAGCGSVPVIGLVEELVFDVALHNVLEQVVPDSFSLLVSAPAWVEPAELPKTGVPALALLGLGAAGLLTGGALFGVRARSRWQGTRRA